MPEPVLRDVVVVEGPDAATYLQGQLSQDVLGLDVGDSAWTFVLQPQGKVDAWFRLTRVGDEAFLADVRQAVDDVRAGRAVEEMKLIAYGADPVTGAAP